MGNTSNKKVDEMLKSLQHNLPVIRKAAKLSQQDLASTLGISRQTVNNWENEKTFLNPMQGLAIMAILQSIEKSRPGLGKIVGAVLYNKGASSEQVTNTYNMLDEKIVKYVIDRMNEKKAEEAEAQDDDDEQELTAG